MIHQSHTLIDLAKDGEPTLGPWEVDTCEDAVFIVSRLHGDSGPTIKIAKLAGLSNASQEDARLLAAAHDMAALLREITAPIPFVENKNIPSPRETQAVVLVASIRQAARGILARIDGVPA